jgi:hypothetical protein
MNVLTSATKGLIGLFIDDGKLALTVIGVLILVWLLMHFNEAGGALAMALLVVGTIGALLANVVHAASTTRR